MRARLVCSAEERPASAARLQVRLNSVTTCSIASSRRLFSLFFLACSSSCSLALRSISPRTEFGSAGGSDILRIYPAEGQQISFYYI